MRLLCSWYRRRFRQQNDLISPSPSADATSGQLSGATIESSSTPEPGRRSSRRERLGRALVDHVRRRRRVGACALTHRPGASLPVAPRRKPAFSFFSNHDDLALTSPFHLRGFHSTRRVSSRRSSHTQPWWRGVRPRVRRGVRPRVRLRTRRSLPTDRCVPIFFFRRPSFSIRRRTRPALSTSSDLLLTRSSHSSTRQPFARARPPRAAATARDVRRRRGNRRGAGDRGFGFRRDLRDDDR